MGGALRPQRAALQTGLAVAALAGCVVMTSLQLRHWRNSITLLQHAAQVEPGNFLARVMLGNAFSSAASLTGAKRIPGGSASAPRLCGRVGARRGGAYPAGQAGGSNAVSP